MTPHVVKWLSGVKDKNLNGCGKLTLTGDMNEISDVTNIDLSNVNSLVGRYYLP